MFRTGVFTVFLLGSSVSFWFAERCLRLGQYTRFRQSLMLTIGLGVVFLCGQAVEYAGLMRDDVWVDTNLFAATFFTVTGFHGFHVFAGVVVLGILAWLAKQGFFREDHQDVVSAVGIYWHFVDVVWIAVFAVVYLGFLQ